MVEVIVNKAVTVRCCPCPNQSRPKLISFQAAVAKVVVTLEAVVMAVVAAVSLPGRHITDIKFRTTQNANIVR